MAPPDVPTTNWMSSGWSGLSRRSCASFVLDGRDGSHLVRTPGAAAREHQCQPRWPRLRTGVLQQQMANLIERDAHSLIGAMWRCRLPRASRARHENASPNPPAPGTDSAAVARRRSTAGPAPAPHASNPARATMHAVRQSELCQFGKRHLPHSCLQRGIARRSHRPTRTPPARAPPADPAACESIGCGNR